MRILKLTLIVLGFLLLNSSSCRKDEEETLPPETQTGANTFGCLVNGNVWRNNGVAPFPGSNLNTNVGINYFTLGILNTNNKDINQTMSFTVFASIKLGKYNLNSEQLHAKFANEMTNCFYQTDSIETGILEITNFDTLHYIISGRFNFKAVKLSSSTGSCDSIVNITEGRFDIKYAN